MRKLIFTAASLLGLIVFSFWSNSNLEARRQQMQTLKKGMHRAEIEALLSVPNEAHTKARGGLTYTDLIYISPVMTVTVCNDSATSASFYEGKSEIVIFE
jgi:CHASE3 domain sensor protein